MTALAPIARDSARREKLARSEPVTPVLRYGQCWEDADVLLAALDVQPGDRCLSIASAGDNTLSLLTRSPARVIAVDLNPAQLAALELRVAAFRRLAHPEVLELLGARPSTRREELYARCRPLLGAAARRFWDPRPAEVGRGIAAAGKFERYLTLFRRVVLPLVHPRAVVDALLAPRTRAERERFYATRWDTMRWRLLFRLFFSRAVLGRLGRDASCFRYVEGSVATHLEARVRHGLVELDPASNPYLHWILTGSYGDTLPHALRPEHFDTIRHRLDRLEWHCAPLDRLIADGRIDGFERANLSDIFEYMSPADAAGTLEALCDLAPAGARLVYWNMMVPRRGSELVPGRLRSIEALERRLHAADRAVFYRALVAEEVLP